MKTYLLTGLALLAVSAARAEWFRPHFRDHGYRGRTVVSIGVPYYGADYGYYTTLSNYDGYADYGRYTAGGLWLGALTGAIIGHDSGSLHHSAGRGAALGAGVGLLLGALADANRPVVSAAPAPMMVAPQTVATVPSATPSYAAPPAVDATPMAAANALFGR